MERRTYFDHNATTPVHPDVAARMMPFLHGEFGNPSSAHDFGRRPREVIDEAREQVAALLDCRPGEVVFTSGGTESDNLAITGAVRALKARGRHLVTAATEHHAVLHTCRHLEEHEGFTVTVLPVDDAGRVEPAALDEILNGETSLVTIMTANNETGTINPVRDLAAVARKRGVLFHTDAVQAVGKVPVTVSETGVDLLSLSGHKIYGPKGTGALFIREGVAVEPILHGGGHEGGRRAGTENIPGIAGLGLAAAIARRDLKEEARHLRGLRDYLWERISTEIPDVTLNGHPVERLPGTLNVSFPRIEAESALLMLDHQGFSVSTGSACSSEDLEPSHVLKAMGRSNVDARGSIRISLGRDNTREEAEAFMAVLPGIIARLREMSPL